MALNSLTFLVFLAVGAAAYYAVPAKLQNALLLVLSFVFYMWAAPLYGLTLAITIAAGYFFAGQIAKTKSRGVLCLAIVLLVGALVATKYLSFLGTVLSDLFGAPPLSGALKIIIPLGISFYTLQLVGYLIDIKNGKAEFERDFVVFALFVAFFPQITSGPIGRGGELVPQFKETRRWSYEGCVDGLSRFLGGAFKKVVLADGFALIVGGVYGDLPSAQGSSVALAALLFSFQLYFDFSGYTDMAIGAAKLFGITLRENFSAPYFSANFSTFWSRWHMSLSSWLQDYVFVPLVWSRWWNKLFFGKNWEERPPHFLANIIIVFLVSGLWHGAAYTFVVWGLIQGLYRVGEELLHKWRKRPKKLQNKTLNSLRLLGKRLAVFALWTLSLVFFRLPSVSDAIAALTKLLGPYTLSDISRALHFTAVRYDVGTVYYYVFIALLAAGLLLELIFDIYINQTLEQKTARRDPLSVLARKPRFVLSWLMGLATAYCWLLSVSGDVAKFIYAGF